MAKIVLDAGHWLYESGRRCLKKFDANETREWELNKRIVEKVQAKLKDYENVEVLRVDDPTGKTFIDVDVRARKANNFKADIYCSFHHNAGVNGGSGGGITVLTYDSREELSDIRTKLYTCLINAGGIKGNRSQPLQNRPDLAVLRDTNMNAVLVEHGFMDSKVDTPIILTDAYAEKMANGWIAFFEQYLGIKKKVTATPKPTTTPTVSSTNKVEIELDTLSNGDKGKQVETLQILLMADGYDVGKAGADGVFGNNTESAVKKFQSDNQLVVDGIVGKNTWNALLK